MILEDRFDQAASHHRMAKAHAVHRFAVACTSLAGREMTSLNAGAASHPASTIKLAILAEAFHAASGSRLALDDRLEVFNRFSSLADGSPYQLDPADDADPGLYASAGGQTTVLELLRHMVGQGSNLAANLLLDRLGADQVTAFVRSLGASELVVRRWVQGLRAYERGLNNSPRPASSMYSSSAWRAASSFLHRPRRQGSGFSFRCAAAKRLRSSCLRR